jgi:hypothetical protein
MTPEEGEKIAVLVATRQRQGMWGRAWLISTDRSDEEPAKRQALDRVLAAEPGLTEDELQVSWVGRRRDLRDL